MSKQPLVTIVIPTFNGGEFLQKTLDSLLSQELEDWEAIIVDDASTDNTREVLQKINDQRFRIFLFDQNVGAQKNWNRALKYVNGKYYKLLPQDDIMERECLREQVAIFEHDEDELISLVFASRRVIGPYGDRRMVRGYGNAKSGRYSARKLVVDCLRSGGNIFGEPGSGLIRAKLLPSIGPYTSNWPYVIDMDFWIRSLEYGDGFYHDKTYTRFRLSKSSWSVALTSRQAADYFALAVSVYDKKIFRINKFDLACAWAFSRLNAVLRFIYYKLAL